MAWSLELSGETGKGVLGSSPVGVIGSLKRVLEQIATSGGSCQEAEARSF